MEFNYVIQKLMRLIVSSIELNIYFGPVKTNIFLFFLSIEMYIDTSKLLHNNIKQKLLFWIFGNLVYKKKKKITSKMSKTII